MSLPLPAAGCMIPVRDARQAVGNFSAKALPLSSEVHTPELLLRRTKGQLEFGADLMVSRVSHH